MKGIILAGGSGTRLAPMTQMVSKQLLPVYDKPMIYYPLSTLMLAGIKDILIISTPRDLPMIKQLLGTGHDIGIDISYMEQAKPEGIAQAFILGKKFIGKDPVCLVLGDNIFYGDYFTSHLQGTVEHFDGGAHVFAYRVRDPERYGVMEFDASGTPSRIVEKPKAPRSNWAVTGIYIYDNDVVDIATHLKPSARGELEITDVNSHYLAKGKLHAQKIDRGNAWLDTGTPDALLAAAQFVQTIEERQGLKVACIEEIALRKGYIDEHQFQSLISYYKNAYGEYLRLVLNDVKGEA